jgi:hypothetical protein
MADSGSAFFSFLGKVLPLQLSRFISSSSPSRMIHPQRILGTPLRAFGLPAFFFRGWLPKNALALERGLALRVDLSTLKYFFWFFPKHHKPNSLTPFSIILIFVFFS